MSATRIWWITEAVAGSPNPTLADLRDLMAKGFSTLVCLLDEDEPPGYEPQAARDLGYAFHHLPIADFGAPSPAQFRAFLEIAGQSPGKTTGPLLGRPGPHRHHGRRPHIAHHAAALGA